MYADDVSHLWEAVFMLEYARSNGTNPQFMLLLMKLYGHLGATECVTVLFQALNIKHLQMDSLGYEKNVIRGQMTGASLLQDLFASCMQLPFPLLP